MQHSNSNMKLVQLRWMQQRFHNFYFGALAAPRYSQDAQNDQKWFAREVRE